MKENSKREGRNGLSRPERLSQAAAEECVCVLDWQLFRP